MRQRDEIWDTRILVKHIWGTFYLKAFKVIKWIIRYACLPKTVTWKKTVTWSKKNCNLEKWSDIWYSGL